MDGAEHDRLVDRLVGGDDSVLAELFSFHRDALWRMLHFRIDPRLHGRIDADDLLQDVFLDASQRVEAYRSKQDGPFFVWLRLVAAQTLADVHRRHLGAQMRDAGRERPLRVQASSAAISRHLLCEHTSPSQAAMRAERSARLEELLDRMDPMDREVLVLRHFEELGNTEVAAILDIKPSAASNRYVRALARMKEALSRLGDDDS